MKKNTHPQTQEVNFTCSSCKTSFTVVSTSESPDVVIEVCSQCHPFYLGKSTMGRVTGRAEKLLYKFEAGKKQIDEPVKKDPLKKKKAVKKVRQSLADLDVV